ncbi:hypothetical protein Athai_06220 [Actinocatenispora thailandica]|uniref:N-acetyltransferase domain-containing protein n=1 Tax=Actinocatenispora thailandica TaxID=227318 RepID=A0A7R7DJZ2_9ACTN|nr:GNAT family N-acetyltransferase [Actinocatenispora thailandica]BCJ33119.1 hypothetical protein Athai_06220 [Actinocatenispora thailandica]
MSATEFARAVAFGHAFARRQAVRVVDVPGGFGVLDGEFSQIHDLNRIICTGPVTSREIAAAADGMFDAAGLAYRQISVDGPDGAELVTGLTAAGYQATGELLMAYHGGQPPAGVPVTVVQPAVLLGPAERAWREEVSGLSDGTYRQLAEQRLRRPAELTRRLAVLGDDGAPRAWCELYLSAGERVAQVEDLLTLPGYRGRGYGSALLSAGVAQARAAGCDLTFLRVEADDGPVPLYRRLGFEPLGEAHQFHRAAGRA